MLMLNHVLPSSSHRQLLPVWTKPRRSAAARPCPCQRSSTTALSPAAATRLAQRATRASPSVASAGAGPTLSAATAHCVPPATGASPTADVSHPCRVRGAGWVGSDNGGVERGEN